MYSQIRQSRVVPNPTTGSASLEQLLNSPYPSRLSLYETPPDLEVSIEEFETFALDRLKVLKEIELAVIRGPNAETTQKKIIEISTKYFPLSNRKVKSFNDIIQQRRKDYISHFILRLSFSRTEELRTWFVKQESLLFKARFQEFDNEDRSTLFKQANLDLVQLSESECAELNTLTNGFCKNDTFYKASFEKAFDLISSRKVFLKNGFAFVPSLELIVLLVDDFKHKLSEQSLICSRALPKLEGDDRLLPVLQNMSAQYSTSEYQSSGVAGEISSSDVDKLSKFFPPCMLNLHQALMEKSHLKHSGRMQYGLFLKGIGLKLQEALIFWKSSFSKHVNEQKFNKDYAYNIRHNYGVEGRRSNYSPYSCAKIIVGFGFGGNSDDVHGCPFKTFSPNRLKQFLNAASSYGGAQVTDPDSKISDIVALAKSKHYQVACTRFLEMQINSRLANKDAPSTTNHPKQAAGKPNSDSVTVEGISHPNTYFDLNLSNGTVSKKSTPPSA
ncbi:DNA primase large subunit [Smittium culicis]|uniref:DNA primase large subunit n=1 Tax=Smittium culicis TaxID=133412 RepID=A0A1R1YJJ9_9FUNG|nr:DNA primase large subunit [Smittium culicis]